MVNCPARTCIDAHVRQYFLLLTNITVVDPRSSVICDEDSDGSEYVDVSSRNSPSLSLKPLDNASSVGGESEEFYDDVQNSSKNREEMEETYDEATSPVRSEIDELIYEDFDEVAPPLPPVPPPSVALPPARNPSSASSVSNKASSTSAAIGENDYENMFYGKWDCRADDDNELAFRRGDVVLIVSRDYDRFGWWVGKLNGIVGLVPRDYMTPAYELVSE